MLSSFFNLAVFFFLIFLKLLTFGSLWFDSDGLQNITMKLGHFCEKRGIRQSYGFCFCSFFRKRTFLTLLEFCEIFCVEKCQQLMRPIQTKASK